MPAPTGQPPTPIQKGLPRTGRDWCNQLLAYVTGSHIDDVAIDQLPPGQPPYAEITRTDQGTILRLHLGAGAGGTAGIPTPPPTGQYVLQSVNGVLGWIGVTSCG